MKITLHIRVEFENKKEGLSDFRDKFTSFKQHVERMQINGTLPRGEVRWVIGTVRPEPPTPTQAAVAA